jgi:hypothetical protein
MSANALLIQPRPGNRIVTLTRAEWERRRARFMPMCQNAQRRSPPRPSNAEQPAEARGARDE